MRQETLSGFQVDESTVCPTCDRSDFASERGMKTHHAKSHGESLIGENDSTMTDSKDRPWRDKDTMVRLYCEQSMTMEGIAEELGCSVSVISRWVGYHGIESRPRSRSGWESSNWKPYSNFEMKSSGHEIWRGQFKGEREVVPVHRLLAVAEFGFDAVCGMNVHHGNTNGDLPECEIPWANWGSNLKLSSRENHSRYHQMRRIHGKRADAALR